MDRWNWMMIEFAPGTNRGAPMIGPGELSRTVARDSIQQTLSRMGTPMADVWRKGAKDDTVTVGNFVFAIYQHKQGQSQEGAVEWRKDFAALFRAHGQRSAFGTPV
ncbi:hypothetical protein [Cryobacterium sp. TMT2-4]|uniref:hypothetical protein n=1 Tax=Cryobacterium sp. TMT2-4 TaxID=1259254 RepID=UPI00106D9A93|nr:hypothetical protein [Cryobacterium sp. TMT2-4]TFC67793.1 hypothetical protein E3O54_08255 [Cryobacterium sp. TMT2-4]